MRYYKLTEYGLKTFEENALNTIWTAMDNDYKGLPNIQINIGSHRITVPLHADSFENLLSYLSEQSKEGVL